MSDTKHFSEEALEDLLRALLQDDMSSEQRDLIERVTSTHTYEDASILTRQRGLVIRTDDDWEFQVSIVVSRRGVETVSCPNCGHEYDDDGDELDMMGYCDFCRPVDKEQVPCPKCGGTGYQSFGPLNLNCDVCSGTGLVDEE